MWNQLQCRAEAEADEPAVLDRPADRQLSRAPARGWRRCVAVALAAGCTSSGGHTAPTAPVTLPIRRRRRASRRYRRRLDTASRRPRRCRNRPPTPTPTSSRRRRCRTAAAHVDSRTDARRPRSPADRPAPCQLAGEHRLRGGALPGRRSPAWCSPTPRAGHVHAARLPGRATARNGNSQLGQAGHRHRTAGATDHVEAGRRGAGRADRGHDLPGPALRPRAGRACPGSTDVDRRRDAAARLRAERRPDRARLSRRPAARGRIGA